MRHVTKLPSIWTLLPGTSWLFSFVQVRKKLSDDLSQDTSRCSMVLADLPKKITPQNGLVISRSIFQHHHGASGRCQGHSFSPFMTPWAHTGWSPVVPPTKPTMKSEGIHSIGRWEDGAPDYRCLSELSPVIVLGSFIPFNPGRLSCTDIFLAVITTISERYCTKTFFFPLWVLV